MTLCEWCGAPDAEGTCPRSLACPDCHANPGTGCKRPSGHEADRLHAARVRLAEGAHAFAPAPDPTQLTLEVA